MLDLTPGLVLGARFALVRRLGRGGSAEVWLADDRERGEPVALKVFEAADPPDPGLARRIGEEIARARGLPRGHAVGIHGVVEADGLVLLAMEYLPGGDLGQFRGRSFESWAAAVDDVAAALAACHGAGLVHRDLKCGNVLLDAAGRAKLADFGLAAAIGSRVAAGGSPYNASPQQLRGEPPQPADDLYALGALLYELIAGHPPWYPEVTRDRVLLEPVPPLVPRAEVPVSVRELALRLLAKSPRERPARADEVRARLAAAGADQSGLVEPVVHVLPADRHRPPRGRGWLPVAVIAAVAAVAAAFLWLPQQFEGGGDFEQQARSEAERVAQEQQAREQALADAAAARTAADEARGRFDAAFAGLDGRAAARWATADFAAARDAGAGAAQRYAVEDYRGAAAGWDAAAKRLADIEARRPQALADALARGAEALEQGRTDAARDEFGLVLAMQPEHAAAKAGMARAGKIEQTFAIVDAALADERAGRLAAAEQGFRRALAIDAAAPGAADGLARLAARRSGEAYAAAMSRGLADMAAGRTDPARAAFREALALRPSSGEAADALAALEQGQRANALKSLELRARTAESDERWDDALAAWRQAAALEPSLATASEGIARATPRAELQRRIEAINRNPERLWDAAGRAEARRLVAAAAAEGNPRQRLAAAAAELERLAAAAQQPVRLRLRSDGVTSVTIYRVGQYGSFSERDVDLLPGRYTVVGTRNGYRDVRQEVLLPPGQAPTALVVKCEEPI